MFASVIFVVSSSSELQSPPLSTRNILAPGTTLVLSSHKFHIQGEGWLKMPTSAFKFKNLLKHFALC